jgi:hypothetical protein
LLLPRLAEQSVAADPDERWRYAQVCSKISPAESTLCSIKEGSHMPTWALALIAFLILVVPCIAIYFWLRVFNGPDGERYRKLRMQGPFVPLSDAEIQADAERLRSRHVQEVSGRGDE